MVLVCLSLRRHIHIKREASATLLVLPIRAMREPLYVERAT